MTELFAQRGESCVSERRDICKNWITCISPKCIYLWQLGRGRSNDVTELFAPRGESCVSERRDICKNWIKLYLPKVYTSVAAWRRSEQ